MSCDDLHPSIKIGPINLYTPGMQTFENFRRRQAVRVVVTARYNRQARPYSLQQRFLAGSGRTVMRRLEHIRPQVGIAMDHGQLSETVSIRHKQSCHVRISDLQYN